MIYPIVWREGTYALITSVGKIVFVTKINAPPLSHLKTSYPQSIVYFITCHILQNLIVMFTSKVR